MAKKQNNNQSKNFLIQLSTILGIVGGVIAVFYTGFTLGNYTESIKTKIEVTETKTEYQEKLVEIIKEKDEIIWNHKDEISNLKQENLNLKQELRLLNLNLKEK